MIKDYQILGQFVVYVQSKTPVCLDGDGKSEVYRWSDAQCDDCTLQLYEQPLE
ncbi:MAG: hypothetical protein HRT35_33420 [Algicola sp.]|nr:hypothetical protein [Algicola sp.]